MPRVVPWINNHELCQVFHWLYADINTNPELPQRGVDRVKAWMSRGKVPISVRSSMDLVEVQLSEQKCQSNLSTISENELRLMYSSALIRFINGIEDGQQKGFYAKSLLSIAGEIGLPIWLVQVRHAATHGDLPTLNILRRCCIQSLQWLYDNYWVLEVNPEALKDVDEKTTFKLRTLLNYYKVSRKAFLKGEQSERLCTKSLDNFFKAISPNIIQELIIPLIIGFGGMIPISTKKRVNSLDAKLPDNLISLWMPVLEGLNQRFPNFVFDLIYAIINELEYSANNISLFINEIDNEDKESDRKKHPSYPFTLVSWLRHFIIQSSSNPKPLFYQDIIDDIVGLCLKNPNIYTVKVLRLAASTDKELEISLKPFISYINTTLTTDIPSIKNMEKINKVQMDNELNTLNMEISSLKKKFHMNNDNDRNVDKMEVDNDDNEELVWKQAKFKEWKSCPIGCLPNGEVPDLYLEL